ncbi:MAG: hypothetical protein BWY08_00517 [Bacteroidetes bacterium ADurb.Bin174]|nr:MAG: hypothetical protein BWY08_00517 [Bacteroidetes bacterium ADurb.Bin174]
METSEIIKKVRKIEIKTRGLSNHIFAGEYHSAFKGRGMTFSEVREYQYGDDVRSVDWNVTARFAHPYIKVFEEERELTVMLLIDVSGSRVFGTVSQYKMDIFTEVAAVLAFSTIHNNDKVGVIFFSDKIEKFIPPKKGRKHVLHIIREMIDFKPESKQTDIAEALRYFTNAIKKRSTAFIISDFIGHDFEKELTIANKKHDVVALQVYDIRETEIPDVGLIKLKDSETEQRIWVDTSDKRLRLSYKHGWAQSQLELQKTFTKSGVDFVSMSTSDDYVRTLIKLFKMRS